MMTEEEARKKWCPMSRKMVALTGAFASNMPNPEADTCAASLCMAWRFKPQMYHHNAYQTPGGYGALAESLMGSSSGGTIGLIDEHKDNGMGAKGTPLPRQGYCGLAGKP